MASKSAVEKKDRDLYFKEARTWETIRLVESEKSKKRAWLVAGVSSAIAFVAVVAVAGMTPLKRTELRVLTVDNGTGIVNALSDMSDAKTTYSETVNKYFTQLYLRYREGYSRELAEEYYYSVGLMSGSIEQRRYADSFNPKNPLSPLNVYGSNARVRIQVKSISFLKDNAALVRYSKEIDRGTNERPAVTHWAATLVFKFAGSPMSERDRAINPLGFQVLEYRNDPDSQQSSESAPVAAQQTQAPAVGQNTVVVLPGQAPTPVPLSATQPAPVVPAIQGGQQ